MKPTPDGYPLQEPEEGDAIRVRFIDVENKPQTLEGEVIAKHTPSEGDGSVWWEAHVDAGHTKYFIQYSKSWNTSYNAQVDGYGPACEIVIIS